MKTWLKKGDQVQVMTGKDRGKSGKTLRVLAPEGRIIVEGVNVRKLRERSRRAGRKGQVVERPSPIAIANVLLFCPVCGRGRRLGRKIVGEKKVRICRKCGREL